MRLAVAAAIAALSVSSLSAQTAAPPAAATDFTYAIPLAGTWIYASTGGEATFLSASAMPQLTIRCDRTARRIGISKPASVAVPFLNLWTSTAARNVPASFDPATKRQTIQLAAYDPLLDALAFSHGRFAVYVSGSPALVLPAWPEVARVIEDCRS
jgi:hypothetical protein